MFRNLAKTVLTRSNFTKAAVATSLLFPMSIVHAQGNKDHHDGNKFKNPWPSFEPFGFASAFKMLLTTDMSGTEKRIKPNDKPETVDIDWNLLKTNQQSSNQLTVTWLGHACIFLQMKGYNIIFDPVFSDRCSPSQYFGPKRYTEAPCQISELPNIDAVVISHNHYDHLDAHTIQELDKLHPDCKFFVPLGNKQWFKLSKPLDSQGNDRVIEMDWWDQCEMQAIDKKNKIRFTCTPAQHQSARTPFDKDRTLWSSWCVEGLDENNKPTKGKIFFGGDTGYRTIPASTKPEMQYDYDFLDTLPHCPAFKEIGEKVGPFDLALIPIGAYSPRWFMSAFHCSPEDAVDVHRDIKSKHSIAIHWGTFVLTDEPVEEPPKRLAAAMTNRGLNKEDFGVLPLGGSFTTTISN